VVVTRVELNYEGIGAVMREPGIRAALKAHADRIADRAKMLAADAPGDPKIEVEEGTRPKGRPFAQVTADHPDGGWGGTYTQRLDLLNRAVESTGGTRA
jgi:hypothetical protein